MNLLVLNCGSSSVKFQVFRVEPESPAPRRLLRGALAPLGKEAVLSVRTAAGTEVRKPRPAESAGAAIGHVLMALGAAPLAAEVGQAPAAIGHRVVHGGTAFTAPVRVDETVLARLTELEALAPLHNGPSVGGIRAALAVADVPQIAVFDTAFHHTLPEHAWRYALPEALVQRHGIRRYGFHGTSYRYVLGRLAALMGTPQEALNAVLLHLGSGASACAVRHGRSVDTTMGFTPLEGLVMGTRSGDLDPALVTLLQEREGLSPRQVEHLLNHESGLLGVSGLSNDMQRLLEAEGQNPRARAAVELFCYRARKTLGALLAALGGAQAVVFTGGIGENAPAIRERICAPMAWCGIALDAAANSACRGTEVNISTAGSALPVWVIPTDEELQIARECVPFLR